MNDTSDLLTRRVEKILPSKEGLEKLLAKKKIRLYQGFDPSKPNLHIGHLVGLLQLKAFQDAGHEVIFLIGDFTGMIGDPTDKSATRPKLTKDEVRENAKSYKDQAGKILRFEGENAAKVMFNSDWLEKLSFVDIIELSSYFTSQQLLERDMFQERIKNEKPIFLHELLYPLMVTYDALEMKVDLEVGGNDQLFNMTIGRSLIKAKNNIDKYALTTQLLADSTGNKIGKTTGNAINLFKNTSGNNLQPYVNLYGQIMSISDELIIPTFKLATTVPLSIINQYEKDIAITPMETKRILASEIVQLCHGQSKMIAAQAHYTSTIQKKEVPVAISQIEMGYGPYSILSAISKAGIGESNSERKRMIENGGVKINNKKITEPYQEISITSGVTIKYGKTWLEVK